MRVIASSIARDELSSSLSDSNMNHRSGLGLSHISSRSALGKKKKGKGRRMGQVSSSHPQGFKGVHRDCKRLRRWRCWSLGKRLVVSVVIIVSIVVIIRIDQTVQWNAIEQLLEKGIEEVVLGQ
jgi:hypothetical protein